MFTSAMISILKAFDEPFLRDTWKVHPLTTCNHSFTQPVKRSLKTPFRVLEMQRLLKASSGPPAHHVQGSKGGDAAWSERALAKPREPVASAEGGGQRRS